MGTNDPFIEWLSTDPSVLLPLSPVQRSMATWSGWNTIHEYAGYINWLIPIGWMLDVLVLWVVAIGSFYLVQWLLRTFNVIGS